MDISLTKNSTNSSSLMVKSGLTDIFVALTALVKEQLPGGEHRPRHLLSSPSSWGLLGSWAWVANSSAGGISSAGTNMANIHNLHPPGAQPRIGTLAQITPGYCSCYHKSLKASLMYQMKHRPIGSWPFLWKQGSVVGLGLTDTSHLIQGITKH